MTMDAEDKTEERLRVAKLHREAQKVEGKVIRHAREKLEQQHAQTYRGLRHEVWKWQSLTAEQRRRAENAERTAARWKTVAEGRFMAIALALIGFAVGHYLS